VFSSKFLLHPQTSQINMVEKLTVKAGKYVILDTYYTTESHRALIELC
jgi:hypothetical protein